MKSEKVMVFTIADGEVTINGRKLSQNSKSRVSSSDLHQPAPNANEESKSKENDFHVTSRQSFAIKGQKGSPQEDKPADQEADDGADFLKNRMLKTIEDFQNDRKVSIPRITAPKSLRRTKAEKTQ